jgi:PEP-CTERM motif
VQTLRLSAALAALILTASTTCAAVLDLSTALGPSGHYTTQAYYQGMLGGQPMTAAQQAYADQEDQLRQLGFLSELGGDFALGQIFYHMAYGITPPPPLSPLDLASGGVTPPSVTPSGLVTGASDGADAGAGSMLATSGNTGSGLTLTGVGPVIAVPEASTWTMMLIGFAGLGLTVYRRTRRRAALVTAPICAGQSF